MSGPNRRLAAILAADVAGYSSLMGRDEEATLSALRALRKDTFEPLVVAHRGHVVKRMGDGWLVEFTSVVDAVECAILVQEKLADDPVIKLRMGLHIGDIVHEDEDIYGGGINIAARLQEISEPGAIALSGNARRSLDGKLAEKFRDIGEVRLKNIDEAVRVYIHGDPSVRSATSAQAPLALPDKPSIAVLPFDNLSGDPEQDYFSDGIVEGITAALSRIKTFFVIARTSAYVFKDEAASYDKVREALGVRYFLEGSVQKAGERVRITVQLIETAVGAHVWAEKYDGNLSDIFELQDTIIEQVAGALQPNIRQAEIDRSRRKPPQDLDTYDLVMRAMPYVWSLDQEDNAQALELLTQAIEIDANYPIALSLAAWCQGQQAIYNWSAELELTRSKALDLAKRAASLSGDDPLVLTVLGAAHTLVNNHNAAIVLLERAVSLDPNSAWAWSRLGWLKTYVEKPQEAIEHFETALRLSPFDPMNFNCYIGIGGAHIIAENFEEAIRFMERGLQEHPQAVWLHRHLIPAYREVGRTDDAERGVRTLLQAYPDITAAKIKEAMVFSDAHMDWACQHLIAAGLPAE